MITPQRGALGTAGSSTRGGKLDLLAGSFSYLQNGRSAPSPPPGGAALKTTGAWGGGGPADRRLLHSPRSPSRSPASVPEPGGRTSRQLALQLPPSRLQTIAF